MEDEMRVRDDNTIQEQCPNCGRFQSTDADGYYAFIEGDDFVSIFCSKACSHQFETKGGRLRSGADAA